MILFSLGMMISRRDFPIFKAIIQHTDFFHADHAVKNLPDAFGLDKQDIAKIEGFSDQQLIECRLPVIKISEIASLEV